MQPLIKEDMPIYKAINNGMNNLTNSEILCLVAGVDNANIMLQKNTINELAKCSIKELQNLGITKSQSIRTAAAFELMKRCRMSAITEKIHITSTTDLSELFIAKIGSEQVENFCIAFLNRSHRINHIEIISKGGMTGTVADPRVIIKLALDHKATTIVLAHNHPSGNLKPSREDENITAKIKSAANFFDINILDHFIVTENGYYSFVEEGLI